MIQQKRSKIKDISIPPLNKGILPGDNFYLHVNSSWIKRTRIPESSASYSVNEEIQEQIDKELFEILRECEIFASKGINAKGSKIRDIIGRLILSSMRFKVQKNSQLLLKQKIQNLHCIRSVDDVGEVLGYLCKHGVTTIIITYLQLERTEEDTSIYNLVISSGLLGLANDTYYKATAPGKLRTLYSYIKLVKKVCNILEIEDLSNVIPIEAFLAHVSERFFEADFILSTFATHARISTEHVVCRISTHTFFEQNKLWVTQQFGFTCFLIFNNTTFIIIITL